MEGNKDFFLTLLGVFGIIALVCGDEAAGIAPITTLDAPALPVAEIPIAASVPISPVVTPVEAVALNPIPSPMLPSGEAVTTETRSPDGSIITVTKYNGQFPPHLLQPHYSGFWSPYGQLYGNQGVYRPYFVNHPMQTILTN